MNFDEVKKQAFVDELEKISASPQVPASVLIGGYKGVGQLAKNDVNKFSRTFGNASQIRSSKMPTSTKSSTSSSSSSSKSSSRSYIKV